ncbi:DoxX family protein [Catenuloplanes japonicus]|uniref:DoxX family protein n=1 Tax=Catenuloplanes japonicus TaxID=33876 RepID=UPI000527AB8E|nr:DoxX family protein [Catenuloplanes japonicus]
MNLVLWTVAVLLGAAMLGAGGMKLLRSRAALAASGLGWVDDFSPGTVKIIGALEVAGGLGLVLPAVTGTATVLVPLAGLGIVIVMIGAVITHARRHEYRMIVANIVLLALAAVVAWGRFGPYAFVS